MALLISWSAFVRADTPSYLLEVMPVLTKAGCNQGACHGKGHEQNGFKLSLRGYAPDDDYRQLTKDSAARRVDLAKPVGSLLLSKPLAETPHEGGKVFRKTSREYTTLLAWIEAGAPGPVAKERSIRSLALSPTDKTLSPNSRQQLIATATFSDGTTADVTWLTKFDSNDAGVARVGANGDVLPCDPCRKNMPVSSVIRPGVSPTSTGEGAPADESVDGQIIFSIRNLGHFV